MLRNFYFLTSKHFCDKSSFNKLLLKISQNCRIITELGFGIFLLSILYSNSYSLTLQKCSQLLNSEVPAFKPHPSHIEQRIVIIFVQWKCKKKKKIRSVNSQKNTTAIFYSALKVRTMTLREP